MTANNGVNMSVNKAPNFCHMIVSIHESIFNVFGSDGKQYVRCPPNKQLNPKNRKKIVKYGDASIMVWVCFTASGLGSLVNIEGIMNGHS